MPSSRPPPTWTACTINRAVQSVAVRDRDMYHTWRGDVKISPARCCAIYAVDRRSFGIFSAGMYIRVVRGAP